MSSNISATPILDVLKPFPACDGHHQNSGGKSHRTVGLVLLPQPDELL